MSPKTNDSSITWEGVVRPVPNNLMVVFTVISLLAAAAWVSFGGFVCWRDGSYSVPNLKAATEPKMLTEYKHRVVSSDFARGNGPNIAGRDNLWSE